MSLTNTSIDTPPERSFTHGAIAGLYAGIIMTVVTIILRLLLGTVLLPEIVAEWFVEIIPGRVFSEILGVLGSYAKSILIVTLLLVQVLMGCVFGIIYTILLEPVAVSKEPRWLRAILFSFVLWVLTLLICVLVMEGGTWGDSLTGSRAGFLLSSFVLFMLYGWIFIRTYHSMVQDDYWGSDSSGRRYFLKWFTVLIASIALGGYIIRTIMKGGYSTGGVDMYAGKMPPEITPNDDFYVISKNFVYREFSPVGWELRVEGMVENPYTLSYADLTSLPWVEEFITMECISNPVGGNLISNAKWRGVLLRDLLERAVLKPGVVDIASFTLDDYSESMTLNTAMESRVIVAYMMNDEPLPNDHGFPARLVVPGIYGEKSSKWLAKIEALDYDFQGFWQRVGWSDDAKVKTTSQIRVPVTGARVPYGELLIGGVAFSGDSGISKVEISQDDGNTWQPAILQEPLSKYTWVMWTVVWAHTGTGEFNLHVRATDGLGLEQVAEMQGTFPDGATGLHMVGVTVNI